ncbi:UBC-like protein [Phialemonium atrogriseum]|uniref:UBC-like protein n=1 Tax=Phialemonium atrogriseum TaxID=1093897 RepID=A0AAJ0FL12_9PEZI|nr:UBC-like protein [Phialemonium atrogriseum]KAK1766873.1 UBC-like protein [Phialemonium atrogriseum]
MASLKTGRLPSMKRQHLLAEFTGLKQACPEGVFVSLTPGDPTLWSGVIFVRKGPYANAILRFQISFPDTYPSLPPLVTFSTDIFHPLITPLTTYMYTTDIQDNGTVSATDEERLPPGGFSLRHGFPHWFGRASRSRQTSSQQHREATTPPPSSRRPTAASGSRDTTPRSTTTTATSTPAGSSSVAATTPGGTVGFAQTAAGGRRRPDVSTHDVLRYVAGAFDDAAVLDAVPLEAAGNPGAWHAWRSRQRQRGRAPAVDVRGEVRKLEGAGGGGGGGVARGEGLGQGSARRPGEWSWEGVWEERVKKGIAGSLSEAVLFGNAGAGDDVINFLNMDENEIEGVKDNLLRTLGASP